MPSSLDLEIRKWVARYLAGEISLSVFEEWFIPATWNVEQSGNIEAVDLAHEIDLLLAEHSNGHWTESELREHFRPLSENPAIAAAVGARSRVATGGTIAVRTEIRQGVPRRPIITVELNSVRQAEPRAHIETKEGKVSWTSTSHSFVTMLKSETR